MAYVPGFKNDVFISYTHVDNLPLNDEEGWITKLHRSLLNALPRKLEKGEGLTIYRDSKLRGNDIFADELAEEYRNSAVFLSILTPSYLASEWCMKELLGFSGQGHPRFASSVANKSRAFRVMPSPHVPRESYPGQLEKSLGYQFYEINPLTDNEEPFRRTKPEDPDQRYWSLLQGLARDIADVLREMRRLMREDTAATRVTIESREAASPSPSPAVTVSDPDTDGADVYVAEVTDDLLDRRDKVRRQLEQLGMRVLPEAPLPTSGTELAEEVRRCLSTCKVSVHLVGPYYGRRPAGEERSLSQIQYAVAAEVSRARSEENGEELTRLVWLKDGLEAGQAADERQSLFLESLEDDPETRVEVLKIGLEELKELVLARARPPVPEPDENPFFYISCTPNDDPQARKILGCLRAEDLEGVITPPQNGTNKRDFQKYHRANLKRCDVFMVLYGSAPQLWVQDQVLEARDVARLRKKKRMALSVCAWPPPPPDKDPGVIVRNLRLLHVSEELRCDEVKRFIREIRRA